jgi:hypothetical protein
MFLDMRRISADILLHTSAYILRDPTSGRSPFFWYCTTLEGAVLTVIEAFGQRPSCVRRSLICFPYLHSHQNVPLHATFRYLSNSLRVQPPTQQIVSKFTPGTEYSKLCFRLSDLCTAFI